MNYLTQILGFRLRRKLYPITTSSIAMYYILLEEFNQVRFPKSMPISTLYLAGELRVSKTTVRNCRNELAAKGYIELCLTKRGCEYALIDLNSKIIKDGAD